jgi:hypothetical protein
MDALHIYGKLPEASDAKCCSGENPRGASRGDGCQFAPTAALYFKTISVNG